MAKNSRFEQATGASRDRLWLHLGNRLRFRREQLRIGSPKAAAHVGVALETYEEYETGEHLIPAKQLADLAELLAVPVFYFFEDLQIGEEKPDVQQLKPDAIYAVATETDRIAALIAISKSSISSGSSISYWLLGRWPTTRRIAKHLHEHLLRRTNELLADFVAEVGCREPRTVIHRRKRRRGSGGWR